MSGRARQAPLTLGHLHIPKTAGTSLNAAIAESLGVREVYFHRVNSRLTDEHTLRLPSKGPARELVLCYPYFSGHMSLGQLQALNRTHVFAVLTDPRVRLAKQFGWVSQAGITHGNSILQWLVASFSAVPDFASPALHLIQNGPRPHDLLERGSRRHRKEASPWIPCRVEHFERLTKSLITIATESPQEAIDYLVGRELIPRWVEVPRLNVRQGGLAADSVSGNLNLPAVEAVINQLNRCTSTEYQFLAYLEKSGEHYFNLPPVEDETLASLLIERQLAH